MKINSSLAALLEMLLSFIRYKAVNLRAIGATNRLGLVSRVLRRDLHVVNSLTRQREPFAVGISKDDPWISWYACGPTVYADAHIGHARTYVALDILRRAAEALTGKPVLFQMGITDVDDKIIAAAAAAGTDPASFAAHFERRFMTDMAALGVLPPTACTRVTEHIESIVVYVARIVDAGFGYVAADGVYFRVEALGADVYGKLRPSAGHGDAAAPIDEEFDAARGAGSSPVVAVADGVPATKLDRRDFALWKLTRRGDAGGAGADRIASRNSNRNSNSDSNINSSSSAVLDWPSPWGRGRPGWHIECSAMTHAVLGPRLHVHAGGIDLAFPHHCNEIAQAEAHNGLAPLAKADAAAIAVGEAHGGAGSDDEPRCCADHGALDHGRWVATWLHTGHVHIDGRKMSKSLKNFITVRAMLAELARMAQMGMMGYTDHVGQLPSSTASAGSATASSSSTSFAAALAEADADADADAETLALRSLSPAAIAAAADSFRWFVAAHRYRDAITYSPGRLQYAASQAVKRREFLCETIPAALAGAAAAAGAPGAAPTLWRADVEGELLRRVAAQLGTGVPHARLITAAGNSQDSASSVASDSAAGTGPGSGSGSGAGSGGSSSGVSAFEAALRDDFDVPSALKAAMSAEDALRQYLSSCSAAGSAAAVFSSADAAGGRSGPVSSGRPMAINTGVVVSTATAIARSYALLGFAFAGEALAALQPPIPGLPLPLQARLASILHGSAADGAVHPFAPRSEFSAVMAAVAGAYASAGAGSGSGASKGKLLSSLTHAGSSAAAHAKALAQAEADAEAAVRALVAVRSSARAAAVALSKAAKKADKEASAAATVAAVAAAAIPGAASPGTAGAAGATAAAGPAVAAASSLSGVVKGQASALMAACDSVRDATLPALGWRLKDTAGGGPALERAPRTAEPAATSGGLPSE